MHIAMNNQDILRFGAARVRALLNFCRKEHPDADVKRLATLQSNRFQLWCSNIGVLAPRHASLDYRLRAATIPKATVSGSLDILCDDIIFGEPRGALVLTIDVLR
jgi:hypothetical protein